MDLSRLKQKYGNGFCLQAEDLKLLMSGLEHWAHRLFPKMSFDDFIERLERLGSKKELMAS